MITIIDYGLGNVQAFANVYKRLNISCQVAKSADDLSTATKFLLPGVGAFDQAMLLLQKSGMKESLAKLVLKDNVPILGVCVGMQILAHSSEEGELPGLGWIEGVVKKINFMDSPHKNPLPHMGWNTISPKQNHKLLQALDHSSRFYFLHSYYFQCRYEENILAETGYGKSFPCVINSNNIYGVQFHPEKSHQNGIQLLKNFSEL